MCSKGYYQPNLCELIGSLGASWARQAAMLYFPLTFSLAFQGKHVESDPLHGRTFEVLGSAVGEEHPDGASVLIDRMLLSITSACR